MKKILFVDDEQQILRALKRVFYRSGYETYYVDSGSGALDIIAEKEIDMIITDIRMPGMDGYTLLEEVKKQQPLTIRIALSGYTDKLKIYKALEDNLIKLYLFKPWDNHELKEMVKRLFELKDTLNNEELLDMMNNIDKLPTIAKLYEEINTLIQIESDMGIIAKVIEKDQSMSAKILRISNSAFYKNKTGSVKEAVIYIGLTNVKNIILANSVFDNNKKNHRHIEDLWIHAKTTNKITHLIYEEILGKKMPTMAATIGLLHDIGKVIFYEHFEDEYKKVIDMNKRCSSLEMIETEKNVLGVSHEEIGAFLLDWWGLPLSFVESALYHRSPLNDNIINKEIVSVIHLANYYSKKLLNYQIDDMKLEPQVFDYLNIKAELIEYWLENIDINELRK